MTGNVALEAHPYYQKFIYQLRQRINYWANQGAITPQELQIMCVMAQNPGQQTIGFVQGLGVRYPNGIDEQHMQQEIDEQFLPALRQAARQRLTMNGAYPMYGGMNMMGGMGMGGMGVVPQSPPPMAAFTSGKTMAGSIFGEAVKPPEPPKPQEPKPAPAPAVPVNKTWKCPEFDDSVQSTKIKICNCVDVIAGRFTLHDGTSCTRMLINDPRIRYISDADAISTYRQYFESFKSEKKFGVVQYKQLMSIPVGREEFTKLAMDVALTISKIENNLVDKLKTIAAITRGAKYSFACSEAYNKLFCDEFDRRMQCGELTTAKSPKMVLNRFNCIADIAAFVGKEIDHSTVVALEAIPDYYKTLNQIVEELVYDIALNLSKKIVNPQKHMSMIGSYMRAIPPIWTSGDDLTIRGTDDLMELWVMSNVQISGSKSDGAIAAGTALKKAIDDLDKQFTVFWLWRTAIWTNYPASSTVAYTETGECCPSVWNLNAPKSDVEFFIGELQKATEEGSDTAKRRASRTIYMEFEESTCQLNFGWTVDAQLWLGCSKYWK